MGRQKIRKAAWTLAAFLAGLAVSNTKVSAAGADSQQPSALQSYVESQGLFYGEYGDCMYTYTNQDKEVKIIGLNKDAEEIKLPGKIDGKKVTSIDLVPRYMFDTGKYGVYGLNLKVKRITLSKYINNITRTSSRNQNKIEPNLR